MLQVNCVINELKDENTSLDDKHFLGNLSKSWVNEKAAKNFLIHLLKCRVFFDKHILKREFARHYKETGKWSLQRLEKDKKREYPKYVGTIGDDDENKKNEKLRTLQSCLCITYTSPKTMHWISVVLSRLLQNDKADITTILEDYCIQKVPEKVSESDYSSTSRIVFSFLDYLLYRNGYHYKGDKIISRLYDDWQVILETQ